MSLKTRWRSSHSTPMQHSVATASSCAYRPRRRDSGHVQRAGACASGALAAAKVRVFVDRLVRSLAAQEWGPLRCGRIRDGVRAGWREDRPRRMHPAAVATAFILIRS
jgi:hypothetical protein